MIIHYNCTRLFLVALVVADLPSLSPFIIILVYICPVEELLNVQCVLYSFTLDGDILSHFLESS